MANTGISSPPEGDTLGYADGLYYYNDGILAVQHQRVTGKPLVRIARTYLDKEYLQKIIFLLSFIGY